MPGRKQSAEWVLLDGREFGIIRRFSVFGDE